MTAAAEWTNFAYEINWCYNELSNVVLVVPRVICGVFINYTHLIDGATTFYAKAYQETNDFITSRCTIAIIMPFLIPTACYKGETWESLPMLGPSVISFRHPPHLWSWGSFGAINHTAHQKDQEIYMLMQWNTSTINLPSAVDLPLTTQVIVPYTYRTWN